MSQVFEGYVAVTSGARLRQEIVRTGSALRFQIVELGNFAIADRHAGRNESFSAEIFALATDLSQFLGDIVAFQYDSRSGHRIAGVYRDGQRRAFFKPADEQWVPLDEQGEPIHDAKWLTLAELNPAEEYETVKNAIDLALAEISSEGLSWREVQACLAGRF